MTALAMSIGMAPMAFGLGEGGEQNAPLGRAVIGGLLFATVATLIFVPVVFSIVHARYRPHSPSTAPAGVPDVAHYTIRHHAPSGATQAAYRRHHHRRRADRDRRDRPDAARTPQQPAARPISRAHH